MATKAEIRDRAANKLGILPFNQDLDHENKVRIESAFDEVYAQLKKDGQATWASTGSSPDELTNHVVFLVAENCLDDYSVSDTRYMRIKAGAQVARREIQKLTTSDFASQDDPQDF